MSIQKWLDEKADFYNQPSFIALDPISVPHRFDKKQDIEIAGFFTAIMSWGQRKTIINKATELMSLMDNSPHQFITQHNEVDRKRLLQFRHRTFQPDDAIFLTGTLQNYYRRYESLEDAFSQHIKKSDEDVSGALSGFHNLIFDQPLIMERTRKHISTPLRKSSCKRLNMFLRWMVREDKRGVDFGIWKKIYPHQLIIPLDLHVGRVARQLGLLTRKQNDWKAAQELTGRLKAYDKSDPVRYDFALFGGGINGDLGD